MIEHLKGEKKTEWLKSWPYDKQSTFWNWISWVISRFHHVSFILYFETHFVHHLTRLQRYHFRFVWRLTSWMQCASTPLSLLFSPYLIYSNPMWINVDIILRKNIHGQKFYHVWCLQLYCYLICLQILSYDVHIYFLYCG